jgi:hypothetical protein
MWHEFELFALYNKFTSRTSCWSFFLLSDYTPSLVMFHLQFTSMCVRHHTGKDAFELSKLYIQFIFTCAARQGHRDSSHGSMWQGSYASTTIGATDCLVHKQEVSWLCRHYTLGLAKHAEWRCRDISLQRRALAGRDCVVLALLIRQWQTSH